MLKEVVEALQSDGMKNIHFISRQGLTLDNTSLVDSLHPNSIGMQLWANQIYNTLQNIHLDN